MSEFRWPVRVYYEDTDSGGVVYYANYLRFMERARTEWLRALGFEQDRLAEEEGVIFAVRSAQIDYLRPARFNDLLEVSVRLTECRRASFEFEQAVFPAGETARPCCTGRIRVACIDSRSLKPRPLPTAIAMEMKNAD